MSENCKGISMPQAPPQFLNLIIKQCINTNPKIRNRPRLFSSTSLTNCQLHSAIFHSNAKPRHKLTLKSPVTTVCTTCCIIKKPNFARTMYLRVPYTYYNELRSLSCTKLTDWSFYWKKKFVYPVM